MSRKLELESLEAELAAVNAMLSESHEISDPVGTLQYEQRKVEIELEIDSLCKADRLF